MATNRVFFIFQAWNEVQKVWRWSQRRSEGQGYAEVDCMLTLIFRKTNPSSSDYMIFVFDAIESRTNGHLIWQVSFGTKSCGHFQGRRSRNLPKEAVKQWDQKSQYLTEKVKQITTHMWAVGSEILKRKLPRKRLWKLKHLDYLVSVKNTIWRKNFQT